MNKKKTIISITVIILLVVAVLIGENSSLNLKRVYGYRDYTLGGRVITQAKDAETIAHKRWGWNAGKEHGLYRKFYGDTFKIRTEGYYRNGKKVGVWRHWDINEKLIREESMDKKSIAGIKKKDPVRKATGSDLELHKAVEEGSIEKIA